MNVNSTIRDLSRGKSNQLINRLKRENYCLKTDLMRFQLLSNCYQKYFQNFNEFSETIESNKEILSLKNNIKALKECEKSCFVSLEMLSENQFKGKFNKTIDIFHSYIFLIEILSRNKSK